jgi:hypothetical protein
VNLRLAVAALLLAGAVPLLAYPSNLGVLQAHSWIGTASERLRGVGLIRGEFRPKRVL